MKKILVSLLLLLSLSSQALASTGMATVFNPVTGHRKVVEIGSKEAFKDGYLLEVARVKNIEEDEDMIGYSVVTGYRTTLSSSMTASGTTTPVSSITTDDDHVLTMDDLGSKVFLVIEPNGGKKEIVMCTGISSLSWTGCTRGLAFYGTSTAAVSTNRKPHSSGSSVIMSNVHYAYEEQVDKDSDETISGVKTYTSYPILPGSTPTLSEQSASKGYVDSVAIQGGATSTETTLGLSQLATQEEMLNGTHDADNPAVLYTNYSNATSSATTIIPITKTNGKLSQGFLDLSEDFTFTGTTTLATTTIDLLTINDYIVAGGTFSAISTTTITGATLPQALYQDSDGYIDICDSDDTSKIKFIGFSSESANSGESINVQTSGIVSGFTGLTEGATYYVQDDKTIGTTIGTQTIKVGIAISETELKIDKSPLYATGSLSSLTTKANADNDEVVTIGFKPSKIVLHYSIQGYTFNYLNTVGTSIIEGTTFKINDIKYSSATLSGDSGILNTTWSNVNSAFTGGYGSSGNVSVGSFSPNQKHIKITLSIPEISETGFTIRKKTESYGGGTGLADSDYNARFSGRFEAFE